jgi:hypothetical protein
MYIYINKNNFVRLAFIFVMMQFWIAIATNYPVLTYYMSMSYIVSHKHASSLLFRCIMSVLHADNIWM